MVSWLLTRRFEFHFSTYEDHVNTNKGDIAIRIAVRRQFERVFEDRDLELEEIGWGGLNPSSVESINRDAALFVISGSGYFHFGRTGDLHPMCGADLKMLERMTCPKVTFGTGVNRLLTDSVDSADPMIKDDSLKLLSHYAEQLELISVRDEFSSTVFSKASTKPVSVIPDPVLSMTPDRSIAPAVGEAPISGHRIGINLAFHGPTATMVLRRNFNSYVEVLRALRRKHDCRLYYFVHSDAERLIPHLLRLSGVPVSTVHGSPDFLLVNYSRLSIHLSQMMHSSVLALAAGTPTMNLAYDAKCSSFYDLMRLQPYSVRALGVSAADLEARIEDLLENREDVRSQIAARKAELKLRSDRFLASVREIVA